MAVDIAQLGFAVDSGSAVHAAVDLDKMSEAGKRAEQMAARMSTGVTAAAKKVQDAAGGLSSRSMEASDRLQKMAQAASALDGPLGGIASRIRSLGALIRETSLGMALLATAAAAAVVAMVRYGIEFVDVWSDLNSRVGLAIGSMDASAVVLDRLATVSRRTYSALETTAESFVRNSTTLRELGKSTSQQLDFTEALNLALVVSGAKADRARMLQEALGRAMAGGALRGQELNSVIEQGGRVAEAIAEELGVGVNQLRAFGNQGKITSEVMYNAMTKRLMQFREEAEKMPATLGDGFMLLRNSFLRLIGTFDQQNKLSESVATGFVAVSDSLQVLARTSVVAASSIALVYAPAIIGGIYTLSTAILVGAVGAMRALTVAIAANPLGALAVVIGTIVSALWQFSDRTLQIGSTTQSVGLTLQAIWTTVQEAAFLYWDVLKKIWGTMYNIARWRFGDAWATAKTMFDEFADSSERVAAAWQKINVSRLAFAANMPKDVAILPSHPNTPSAPSTVGNTADYDKLIEQIKKRTEALKIESATFSMSEAAGARYKVMNDLLAEATKANIDITPTLIANHQELANAISGVTAQLERQRIEREIMAPDEVFAEQVSRLKELYGEDAENFREYQVMKAQYELERFDQTMRMHQVETDMRRKTLDMTVGLLNQFGNENKKAAIAAIVLSKTLAAADIIVSTARASMAAAASAAIGGPFAAAAAAASMKALGAAQLAIVAASGGLEIASLGKSSSSMSSASIGGGSYSSSIASVPTASDNNAKPSQSIYINIEGEKVSRKELEQLVERLNEYSRDGGKIYLT